MTDKRISPLRRRMTEDMTVRGFTAGTQGGYLARAGISDAVAGPEPSQRGGNRAPRLAPSPPPRR